jgi:hypothetical protein
VVSISSTDCTHLSRHHGIADGSLNEPGLADAAVRSAETGDRMVLICGATFRDVRRSRVAAGA